MAKNERAQLEYVKTELFSLAWNDISRDARDRKKTLLDNAPWIENMQHLFQKIPLTPVKSHADSRGNRLLEQPARNSQSKQRLLMKEGLPDAETLRDFIDKAVWLRDGYAYIEGRYAKSQAAQLGDLVSGCRRLLAIYEHDVPVSAGPTIKQRVRQIEQRKSPGTERLCSEG